MLRNISPSNIFPNWLLGKRFHQNHQAVLAAVSINGLKCVLNYAFNVLFVMSLSQARSIS